MHAAPKLTSAAFSEVIRDVHDLYEAALRNGYFLPKLKSSAVNEPMLFNVLRATTGAPSTPTSSCIHA